MFIQHHHNQDIHLGILYWINQNYFDNKIRKEKKCERKKFVGEMERFNRTDHKNFSNQN